MLPIVLLMSLGRPVSNATSSSVQAWKSWRSAGSTPIRSHTTVTATGIARSWTRSIRARQVGERGEPVRPGEGGQPRVRDLVDPPAQALHPARRERAGDQAADPGVVR